MRAVSMEDPKSHLAWMPRQNFVPVDLFGEHAAKLAVRQRHQKIRPAAAGAAEAAGLRAPARRVLEADDIVLDAISVEVDLAHGVPRESDLAAAFSRHVTGPRLSVFLTSIG